MTVIKIALLGDGAVGKTSLRERFMGKGFTTQYSLTVGADFAMKDAMVFNKKVRFQIWDLAGQQRFEHVRTAYYRGAVGGLLVYDVTRPESFFNCPKWIAELWRSNGIGKCPVVILGNKSDLRGYGGPEVTKEQGIAFAERLSQLTRPSGFECVYYETSAKTGLNVDKAFITLGEKVILFAKNLKEAKTGT